MAVDLRGLRTCNSAIALFCCSCWSFSSLSFYFLENYTHSYGLVQNTVSNSRLFSGLSLVPALHILLLLWQRAPPRAFTVAAVIVQSVIFAFLLSCRTEVAWQAAMIAAVACGIGLSMLLRRGDRKQRRLIDRLAPLWPAAIFLVVVFAYSAVVSMSADQRYAMEPKAHIYLARVHDWPAEQQYGIAARISR